MRQRLFGEVAEHVAAAAAAGLWNLLPSIMRLDAVEGFERLEGHFVNAFRVYFEKVIERSIPEPSKN